MNASTLNIVLISICLFAGMYCHGQQPIEVLVQGVVNSPDPKFKPFSYSGIMIEEYRADGQHIISAIAVDQEGQFRHYFPQRAKIVLSTFYQNYFSADTTITTNEDSIYLRFTIHPKHYQFTADQAKGDIAKGLIQVISYDSALDAWNSKIHYTRAFGFEYLFIKRPPDFEFRANIDKYNYEMEEYLASKDSLWSRKLYKIEDSLIHVEADTYWKTHELDLTNLLFKVENISPNMRGSIEKLKQGFNRLPEKERKELSRLTLESILNKIDESSEYNTIRMAEFWATLNYDTIIIELVKRITNNKIVGLKNSADLIIWERVQSGDLPFYGHGAVTDDDLFSVAGRANYLMRKITGENFGNVSMYSTQRNLKKLQKRWAYWILKP